MEQIEANIEQYLGQLNSTDHEEPSIAEAQTARLKDKVVAALTEEMLRLLIVPKVLAVYF
ncbi:hypothetical protein Ga0074115_1161 [endosymbiont of Ridgeia piscesae]|uniref:Uncharacterized protein n=2 Tax=endosymbiont of Ridgeia piscesae TaxID=54398 RepID=A0A0T5YX91_9GAMM|nr:hypothetical protein Ga0074115_1161 [endosymbiont of Ridgeia piscesae]